MLADTVAIQLGVSICVNVIHLSILLWSKRRYPRVVTPSRYITLNDLVIAVLLISGAVRRVSKEGWDIDSEATSQLRSEVAFGAVAVTLASLIR
jgi:hypothetical protein